MNINSTLIVQIIHFVVAFYCIKRFLLAPVIALILEDEYKVDCAQRDIVQAHKNFELVEWEKQQQSQQFYEFVALHEPVDQKIFSYEHGMVIEAPKHVLTSQQEKALVNEIKNSLIIELSDVH